MNDYTNRSGRQEDAEQAVKKFEEELGPFVVAADTTRMPMLFTDARSTENEVVYVNDSFLELTGYERPDALGMPFHCLMANEPDRTHTIVNSIARSSTSSRVLPCRRKDGTRFNGSVLVSPVNDKNGDLQQYFISLVDITVHIEKFVEEHVREAELYKHTPGFIAFAQGPDHRVTFTNAALETLVERNDLVGQPLGDVFLDLGGQSVAVLLHDVFTSGQRVVGKSAPLRLRRGADAKLETRHVDFVIEPVRDASGAVVGLFCEGYDLSNAKALSDKLDDVQGQLMHVSRINAMGTMAATLAHELNQPLAAIVNYASGCLHMLEDGGAHEVRLHEGLSAIEAASKRAGKIISRLRDLTKPSARMMQIFDLSSGLEETVHVVRAGGCDNVSITTQVTPNLLVRGDKIQIEQVMINLLRNACHAAAQDGATGAVRAFSVIRNEQACVVVADNGPGFPIENLDDPFKWTESSKPDGMGIGLSISRTIVENHDGEITVDKTGASGTSISFRLARC